MRPRRGIDFAGELSSSSPIASGNSIANLDCRFVNLPASPLPRKSRGQRFDARYRITAQMKSHGRRTNRS